MKCVDSAIAAMHGDDGATGGTATGVRAGAGAKARRLHVLHSAPELLRGDRGELGEGDAGERDGVAMGGRVI